MFGFTINIVISDYINEKVKYNVLHLQTNEDIFDSNLSKIQKYYLAAICPKILTDADKLNVFINENEKYYKLYFKRDDEIFHKHKKIEMFNNYLFSKLYFEIKDTTITDCGELKFDESYFKKKSHNVSSSFSIDLNIHIKNSIQYKIHYD